MYVWPDAELIDAGWRIYMRHWDDGCRQAGTKPLSEPMLEYC